VSDVLLAEQTKNIDIILGGHTHTFLDTPTEEYNLDGKKVLINQVGWAGIMLGRIDLHFDLKKKKHVSKQNPIKIG
jgi:5'-nucleotidase